MNNVVQSLTRTICVVADTASNTALAVNGLAEAGRIRSESYARVTAIECEYQELKLTHELKGKLDALRSAQTAPKKPATK